MRTELSDRPGNVAPGRATADAGSAAISLRRLPRAAALTAVAAAVANLAVYFASGALWGVPGGFSALNPGSVVATSVVGVVVAALGLVVLARITRRAIPIFMVAAAALTLLSLMGPFQAMVGAMPGMPPATTATGVTMILLHLITGGIIARLLPARARR